MTNLSSACTEHCDSFLRKKDCLDLMVQGPGIAKEHQMQDFVNHRTTSGHGGAIPQTTGELVVPMQGKDYEIMYYQMEGTAIKYFCTTMF